MADTLDILSETLFNFSDILWSC